MIIFDDYDLRELVGFFEKSSYFFNYLQVQIKDFKNQIQKYVQYI